jgi:hypothetical protein
MDSRAGQDRAEQSTIEKRKGQGRV